MMPESSKQTPAGLICRLDPDEVSATRPPMKYTSEWLRQLAHAAATVGRLVLRVIRNLFPGRLKIHFLEGKERWSQNPIRVVYVGDGASYGYFTELLFSDPPSVQDSRTIFWWFLPARMGSIARSADLTAVDVDFPLTLFVPRRSALNVPRWVKQRIPIAGSWDEVLGRLRRKTRREAQRVIRKFEFKAQVIRGGHGAKHFYDRLYKPHILQRYGQAAEVVSCQRFVHECRRAQIIQLLQRGEVVSAVVVRVAGRQLSIVWAGMSLELTAEQKQGAADALDYFSLLYAYQQGCEYLDMGPSRACLNDGLLRYKRKWGAAVYKHRVPQGSILMSPLKMSPAVLSMLTNMKFITLDAGRLVSRIVFASVQDEHALTRLLENDWTDGLQRLRVFMLSSSGSVTAENMPGIEWVFVDNPDHLLEQFSAALTPLQA